MNPFTAHLRKFPPFLCFALARVRVPALSQTAYMKRKRDMLLGKDVPKLSHYRRATVKEIAKKSGIPSRTVERIKSSLHWDGVKQKDVLAYLDACGCAFGSV